MNQTFSAYRMIAFPLAVLMVFTLIPTVLGLALSVFEWGGGADVPRFVGLSHFRAMAGDETMRHALVNTLAYVALSVPPTIVLAFLLAVAVDADWFVGKSVVRATIFMPTIVSIVAIGFVWRWVLDDQAGLLNWGLRTLGVTDPPNWLIDGRWPMVWIILVAVWRGVGFCLVLYLAALSSVNRNLYEAAAIDGASRSQILRYITWPSVRPMTVFLVITSVIAALQVFDLVYIMTPGRENAFTTVLNLYLYRQFAEFANFGYAAAIGIVIFGITLVFTAVQLGWARWKGDVA
ncbi:MAG: carbohydrate ABC transporter permease [Phycisphaerales bacterium JB063]